MIRLLVLIVTIIRHFNTKYYQESYMKITKECFEMIKSFEGLRLESYDDLQPSKPARLLTTIKGTLTIGYGHTKDVYIGQVITVEEAEAYLQQDIQKYEN